MKYFVVIDASKVLLVEGGTNYSDSHFSPSLILAEHSNFKVDSMDRNGFKYFLRSFFEFEEYFLVDKFKFSTILSNQMLKIFQQGPVKDVLKEIYINFLPTAQTLNAILHFMMKLFTS